MYMIIGRDGWGRLFEVGPQMLYERALDTCMRLNHRAIERHTGCVYRITQILDV